METSPERFYEALVSRDPRFDGHFYAGVVTTGIYCRPVCPAPDPKPINVRYFPCAAAAESAGFRPCRRCRPETAPGTPAWLGTSATVSRGLRLISEGALDSGGIEDLAARLGVGSRHLRRLFERHLGASPIAVAQSRRVHFARSLIDQTNLPMKEIAFASGFSSVKRFNTVLRATFQMSPSELRATSGRSPMPSKNGGICLRLPYREPYDWNAMISYLEARAIPGVEQVTNGAYRRSILVDGKPAILEARPDPKRPFLELRASSPVRRELMDVVERVRRMFDLRADPLMIASRFDKDPLLGRAVRAHPGIRVPGGWSSFELAVRAVLGQQISVKGATTLAGRLVEAHGKEIPSADPNGPTRVFPGPEALADANIAKIGMPKARAEALRTLARRVADGDVSLSWGERAADVREKLVAIPGIGEWTAQYITMRALGEPDTFLPGDLGVRRALASGGKLPTPTEVGQRAESWRPWRAYAVLYLWLWPPSSNGKG